jgi:hypothetical protein
MDYALGCTGKQILWSILDRQSCTGWMMICNLH